MMNHNYLKHRLYKNDSSFLFHQRKMTTGDLSKSTSEEGRDSTYQSFEMDAKNFEKLENGIAHSKTRRSTVILSETNWKVVRLTALVIFIYRVQYTVFSGSLHPMLKSMDPEMGQIFYGWISSMYSVGVAISAPVFGILANKLGFRLPVLATSIIMLVMNSGYIILWNIPANRLYYALIIRFFIGIAAGGSSILQFYWVTVTAKTDLSAAASYSDAAMLLGLAFGPVIQILTKYAGDPGIWLFGFLYINMYTIPAMLAIILVLIASAVLMFYFPKEDTKKKTDSNVVDSDSAEVDSEKVEDIPLKYFVIILCFGFRSVQNIIFANFETNNNQFICWMFNYAKEESSTVGSALCSMSGLLGFIFLVCYVWTGTSKRVFNLLGVFIGFFVCIIFFLGSFPYPSYNEFIISRECNATWCSKTPTISFPLFVTVYLLIFSVGFPLLSVHTSALLAKSLGERKQAHIHGLANFVSTVARIAAGPLMGKVLQEQGIEVTWYLQIGLLIITICTIVTYSRIESIIKLVKFLFRKIPKKVGARIEQTKQEEFDQ